MGPGKGIERCSWPSGIDEDRRVERPSQTVAGKEIGFAVSDPGRCRDRVEYALHGRAYVERRRACAAGPAAVGCVGEIEEVGVLNLAQLEGARDRVENTLRDTGDIAALHAHVVVHAHACQHRHFLAPKALDAPVTPVGGNPGLFRRDPGATRRQEVLHLGPVVHSIP